MDHEVRLRTQDGRKKLAEALPGVMTRVLAIQGKSYPGSGFHWEMMKSAGGLMFRVLNYDKAYGPEDLMIDEVVYEDLIESLEAAEAHVEEAAKTLKTSSGDPQAASITVEDIQRLAQDMRDRPPHDRKMIPKKDDQF